MKQQCPKCGNWVEGKKVDTLARKATRKAVRKGGTMAKTMAGAAIGSIVPGIGTLVGGAIGFAADVLMEDQMNNVANGVEEIFFDNTDYEFCCPKCGHKWSEHEDFSGLTDKLTNKPASEMVHQTTSSCLPSNPTTVGTFNNRPSNNYSASGSKNTYRFSLGERRKLAITKYEFASALVEARLVKNTTEAFKVYEAMPAILQARMNKQEAETAKSILKKKHIPFQLQTLQTNNQQINTNQQTRTNQQTESTLREKETRKFQKCFNDYLNNETEIISNLESALSFIDDVSKQTSSINDKVIKSEFFYLNSLCCLFYSKEHSEDSSLHERGNSFIHKALNLLDDEEYKLVALLYQSLLFDNNAPNIASRQEQIGNQCPSILKMENCLLKPEYWQMVYNDLRYDSLLSSGLALEEKKAYQEALLCWQQMRQLPDEYSQLTATYFLFVYHYHNVKDIERNGKKAFEYANEIVAKYDFSGNFDKENILHQNWQTCLSEIGCMYKDGDGVEQNYQKAWEFLSKAAQLGGYSSSFFDLADMYENGLGIPKNINKAIELYQQAADLNHKKAIEKLNELQSKTIETATVIPDSQDTHEAEQEYIEMLKDCLEEDGEISPRERRLLEKLRTKLGISDIRAKELEEQLSTPQLTEEEQEYLEEYKACLEDGEVSSKERRLLEKLRIALNISEERCRELESQTH